MHGARAKGVCQLESKLLTQFALLFYLTFDSVCQQEQVLLGWESAALSEQGREYYTRFCLCQYINR